MMRQRHNAPAASGKRKDALSGSNEKHEKKTSIFVMSSKNIFLFCLFVRMINALLVQTSFNPDEHWQGPEVAHRIAFGYGHLTWEWKQGIRSYLHPLLFVPLYKFLSLFHLDFPWFMMRAPRLFQSLFAAVGDLYLYKFADALYGNHVAQWALFSQLTNWFMFFCIPRPLSNSLETVLTLVSMYYWPCMRQSSGKEGSSSRKWALVFAALACAIRPTSAITWLYVGLLELAATPERVTLIFSEVIPIGALVFGITCWVDRLMYGSWIVVPLNFLKFNFLSSGGDYYGTHVWHWYLTQGFAVMGFSFLPFSIAGIVYSKQWKIAGLIGWVLGMYSLLGHKEFRFVLPVLPIALMFSGYSLASIGTPGTDKWKGKLGTWSKWPLKKGLAIFFLLATNIPMALYMSLVHQRGTEDVMNYLAKEASDGKVGSILFLMPCHATPYYSILHKNVTMRFLDCTPSEDKGGGPDESDRFLIEPAGFATEVAKNWTRPSHIVLFESEEKPLREFLFSHSFVEVKRFFHSHFKVDRDLQASVIVYASM